RPGDVSHDLDARVDRSTARGLISAVSVTRLTAHIHRDIMRTDMNGRRHRISTAAIALAACLALVSPARPASAAALNPDFDSVLWNALGCPNADLIKHDSPSNADFTGSSAPGNEPAYYAFDANFLYFRYRLTGDPSGSHGFAQISWTALMQVPGGDRFKYQYQLSLNGDTDTIEIWKNDPATAQDIAFTPLFHDDAEFKLYST